jgi:type 1 glutamine amidotransferase
MFMIGARTQPSLPSEPDVLLIVTHTTGYRHESIEAAAQSLATMAREAGLRPEIADDPTRFDRPLDHVRVVALVSTTTRRNDPSSEWLVGDRRLAFQRFIRGGGGVLAIHGAADSHYGWPWYGSMFGARFARHPAGTPTGKLTRSRDKFPLFAGMPRHFEHDDEWYLFADPVGDLRPLLTVSAASIGLGGPDALPVSWVRKFEGGRVFYSTLGHPTGAWRDARVLAHYRGGLLWAAGRD